MCDYEDMRDTETQSTAGQRRERGSEGAREGGREEEREGGREALIFICTLRYSKEITFQS